MSASLRDLLFDLFTGCVLPSLLVTGLVSGVVVLVFGLRRAPIAVGLGVLVGLATAHLIHHEWGFVFDATPEQAFEWLPWATLVAVLLGIVTHLKLFPSIVGILLKAVLLVVVAWLVVPSEWSEEHRWLRPLFVVTGLCQWLLLDRLTKQSSMSLGPWLVALLFAVTSWVLASHFASMAEWALCLASCWVGLAIVAAITGADFGGVLGSSTVPFLGMLLNGAYFNFSEVPNRCHWIVTLTPCALLVSEISFRCGLKGWKLILLQILLVTVPLAIMIVWSVQTGGLPWG